MARKMFSMVSTTCTSRLVSHFTSNYSILPHTDNYIYVLAVSKSNGMV